MVVMEEAVVEGAAASEDVNLVELMNARARSYGMLARLFREEVDLPTLRELQKMRFPQATGNAAADEGYHQLYDYLKRAWDDSVTELAIDYVSTFIGHGVNGYSAAYPYESVYTSERRLLMQEARAEVLATLRENELKRGNWNEAEDHIALELEFMQRMALRAAEALSDNAEDEAIAYLRTSYDFLENHLLNWVPMLVADMRMHARTSVLPGPGAADARLPAGGRSRPARASGLRGSLAAFDASAATRRPNPTNPFLLSPPFVGPAPPRRGRPIFGRATAQRVG